MVAEPSAKEKAWVVFDRIVADAAPDGAHSNPWVKGPDSAVHYLPDLDVLSRLLGVPLHLGADTRTGVPALALDVWLSYELRRAGFDADATWPRPVHPHELAPSRFLASMVTRVLDTTPVTLHREARARRKNPADLPLP